MSQISQKVALIAYGNQARGDDGAAPVLLHRISVIQDQIACQLHMVEDMQLGPEHAYDLKNCDAVFFIDCDSKSQAISFKQLTAEMNTHFSSHAQTPETVMSLYAMLEERDPPPCFLLGIGGDQFELGNAMSQRCEDNIEKAQQFLLEKLSQPINQWL